MITHRELQEIKARAEKATPGPWTIEDEGDALVAKRCPEIEDDYVGCFSNLCLGECKNTDDSEFIAASRTDIPKLIDALEEAIATIRFYSQEDEYKMHFNDEIQLARDGFVLIDKGEKAREFLKRYEK